MLIRQSVALLCAGFATVAVAANGSNTTDSRHIADLSIEELMNESITSVAKKEQRIADAAAAVYVLSAQDILRAGHTSIPEALRMVPGLSVAQLDSHTWIITARGFAQQWAGKLLVLIDGRTVYDPFYSGVNWSDQDLLLEDLERIEVIRGPGATLWGANAVNGVINIITKNAQDTQAGLLTAGGGTEALNGAVRYGGQIGSAYYRTYFKYDEHSDFAAPDGGDARDAWRTWRAGFRSDWQSSDANHFTLQGEVHGGRFDSLVTFTSPAPPYSGTLPGEESVSAANILGRWKHTVDERSSWTVQAYYDHAERSNEMLGITRDSFDLELQQQLDVGARHAVVYGAGFRYTQARYEDSFFLSYARDRDRAHLINVFIQDEIALIEDKLTLNVGSKFERNDFTGFEAQPGVRVMWTPDHAHSLWAGVSRAVRTPNFSETGLRINYAAFDVDGPGPTPPRVLSILPTEQLEPETVIANEAGYRFQPNKDVYLDLATFYNVYDNLIVDESSGAMLESTPLPVHLTIASRNVNKMQGHTYGIELTPTWQVTDWWKLAGGYTWLHMQLRSDAIGHAGEEQEGSSPQHQLHVRSLLQWSHNTTFATSMYFSDSLPNEGISSYVRLDMHLGWNPTPNLGVSVGATNLLDDRHAEFSGYATTLSEKRRSVYSKLTWRF